MLAPCWPAVLVWFRASGFVGHRRLDKPEGRGGVSLLLRPQRRPCRSAGPLCCRPWWSPSRRPRQSRYPRRPCARRPACPQDQRSSLSPLGSPNLSNYTKSQNFRATSLAEWSKAFDLSSTTCKCARVRIPQLVLFATHHRKPQTRRAPCFSSPAST